MNVHIDVDDEDGDVDDSPDSYDHVDAAPHGYNHGNDADVDKVAVTCKQSEASAEALACEDRQHKFQKESQLACA